MDRLVAGVATMAVALVTNDEEGADFVIMSWNITEGWRTAQGVTEGDPGGENFVMHNVGFGDISEGNE